MMPSHCNRWFFQGLINTQTLTWGHVSPPARTISQIWAGAWNGIDEVDTGWSQAHGTHITLAEMRFYGAAAPDAQPLSFSR